MRALVTGASGFLGSRLTRCLLRDGWQVTALLRETSSLTALEALGIAGQVTIVRIGDGLGDIVAAATPDVVFHTAAVARGGDGPGDAQDLLQSNVVFPALLLAHMKAAGCSALVNTGTSWQNCAGAAFSPFNLYASSKQAFEDVIEGYCLGGLRATTLRLFDTYGPGDTRNKIADLVIKALLSGEALKMSPGEQVIDLGHIDDIAAGFVAAGRRTLECPAGHEVFALPGERMRLRDLAAMIGGLAGCEVPITWGGREYRPREVMLPFEGYITLPGWTPQTSLHDGMAAQLADWRARLAG